MIDSETKKIVKENGKNLWKNGQRLVSNSSKKTKIIWGLAVVGLVIGGLLVASTFQTKTESVQLPWVLTYTVQPAAAMDNYLYSGVVRSQSEHKLSFQVSGKVTARYVEVGDSVKKGTLLMQLDSQAFAQNALVAQTQLELSKNNLDRWQQLYDAGGVSQAQLESYQASYDMASAQYTLASLQLGYTSLYADCDGIVASVETDIGQVVGPGQNAVTIAQKKDLEIAVGIPENRLPELREAEAIEVSFWALPGVIVKGVASEISPMADEKTHTYATRIGLVDPPPAVELGMTASVQIKSKNAVGKSIFIPISAVYQNGDEPTVWLVRKGVVHQQPVKLGVFGSDQVEVLLGLSKGDKIVAKGVHDMQEGLNVQVVAGEVSE